MKDCKILLSRGSKRNISFVSEDVDNHMQALPLLSSSLRVEQEHDGRETHISLLHLKERAEDQPQPLTAAARDVFRTVCLSSCSGGLPRVARDSDRVPRARGGCLGRPRPSERAEVSARDWPALYPP